MPLLKCSQGCLNPDAVPEMRQYVPHSFKGWGKFKYAMFERCTGTMTRFSKDADNRDIYFEKQIFGCDLCGATRAYGSRGMGDAE